MKFSTSSIGALVLLNSIAGLAGVHAQNGKQKCVKGVPDQFIEYVDGVAEPLTMPVAPGTKCCQHPQDPDRIVLQFPDFPCPCNVEDFKGQEFVQKGGIFGNSNAIFNYKIDELGVGGSLYSQKSGSGREYKVGTFDSMSGNEAFYTLGDNCRTGPTPRKGTFTIVPTDDPDEQRVLTASEPALCVYEMEMKCYQVRSRSFHSILS